MTKINERIKENFTTLSASQKKVAHYILENIEEVALYSAQKIAEVSQVSEATVHRLSQALGFTSFTAMKQDLHRFIRNDHRAVNKLISTTTIHQDGWLEKHFLQEAENIINTSKGLTKDNINQAAMKLLDAESIWVGGWRMSLSVTSYMQFVLKYMLGNCSMIPQGEAAEYTAYFKQGDILFVCAFPRYDWKIVKIAQLAKAKDLFVIALTDSSVAPVCASADLCLFTKNKSKGFLDSYTAAISVCNAIVNEISYIGGDRVRQNIENMEIYFSAFNDKPDKKQSDFLGGMM